MTLSPPAPLIAIIDDDASIRSATASLLRAAGYRTQCHVSADAFLALDPAPACHLILTDLSMPGTSGLALLAILQRSGAPAPPCILMTARTERELWTQAERSTAVCVLRKPFAADHLIGCVERALG